MPCTVGALAAHALPSALHPNRMRQPDHSPMHVCTNQAVCDGPRCHAQVPRGAWLPPGLSIVMTVIIVKLWHATVQAMRSILRAGASRNLGTLESLPSDSKLGLHCRKGNYIRSNLHKRPLPTEHDNPFKPPGRAGPRNRPTCRRSCMVRKEIM